MCSSPPSAWTEDWRTAPRACRPRSHRRISTLDYDSIHCGLTTKSLPLFLSGQANPQGQAHFCSGQQANMPPNCVTRARSSEHLNFTHTTGKTLDFADHFSCAKRRRARGPVVVRLPS